MEEVTDTVFRRVIIEAGRPDVFFTEFTSSEGIAWEGRQTDKRVKVVSHRLDYQQIEKPIIAQIWGITPEDYFTASKKILEMGFGGIDINMGCPVKNVIKQGACSALIKNPNLAKEIILAVKEGVEYKIPVSIKTRIGFKEIQTEEWISFLLNECCPDALTVHGRTVKELSLVPNHWEEIEKSVQLRDELQKDLTNKTLIIGNGDIKNLQEAYQKSKQYNLDGIMVGRGIFSNPWFFNPQIQPDENDKLNISIEKRLEILDLHLNLWEETWQNPNFINTEIENRQNQRYYKNFSALKRFFKIYIQDFDSASKLRAKLMETNDINEVRNILTEFRKPISDSNF
jgi:tRNA-dihydrouridine synthase